MSDPVFDSDIICDWLCGHGPAAHELARYPRHRMSRISWTSLLACEPTETRAAVQELIAPFEIIEVDARIATAAAEIARRFSMALTDALVLATAQVNGAILVTRNIKTFPVNMPGIRIPYTF